MATITLSHLSFGYDGQTELFHDVSFDLDLSWHLGLVGRNGRGKTTLLELMQGQHEHKGKISVPTSLRYFPQTIKDETQLTLYAMQEASDAEQWQLERELNLMHADPDILWRPFNLLSGGEQTKVRLALLFAEDSGFALIDEPTNHLDAASRTLIADYLRHKPGFIVISHDRTFLDAITDHTLAIDKQAITLYAGNYSVYAAERERQNAFERTENAKLKRDIGRLKQSSRDKHDWSLSREGDIHGDPHVKGSGGTGHAGFVTARAARLMKKSKVLEHRMDKEIEGKSQLLKNVEDVPELTINTIPDHHEIYVHVADFTLSYDGQPLFAPLTFDVRRGERVALAGPNGIGKSSLLHALLGTFTGTTTGTLAYPPSLTFSLSRQLYADNTGTIADFAAAHHLNYQDLLNNLKKLGLERLAFTTPIERLSAGQQKKVELAKSLVTPANLLVWDEPLNYLDLYNQDQLATSILKSQPTMLFVEHDRAFINRIATKVITLTPSQA
ncbi:ribosomal protection-like ABC-F family protein [Lacticaseibacillus camelliae]|uniref:ATPase n=1 Tax=Lacticaseibacillus camelliae DSM 22697 = JCM 13995 TaxID=1423730 RepID=A0A0R2F7F6_9LACO|nr:ATP-binding cassette domain-containing protein [Lacticaseibacillus camelliae]KRN21479.1 ATPase [Lacticaseibacillus camelliae DSM 22697 = JCM 13995]